MSNTQIVSGGARKFWPLIRLVPRQTHFDFVRLAVVQNDERLALAARRLRGE